MTVQPVVLGLALVILGIGVGVYLFVLPKRRLHYFHTANLVAWLLIALFPVLVIFSLFPESSSMSIEIKGISAGGAIAAFIFIWRYGTKSGLVAVDEDRRQRDLRDRDEEISKLTKELEVARAGTSPNPLQETIIHRYRHKALTGRELGLITGNLSKVSCVDVWVNSENTNMQMASFFDRSVSGYIRYAGAQKDRLDNIAEDVVGQALSRQLGGTVGVSPGTVVLTESGELRQTHNVQIIAHAAAVQGQAGHGYKQIADVGSCVANCLAALDKENSMRDSRLKSVVFPLMGTGQGRAEVETTVRTLLTAAIEYLQAHRDSSVKLVYFLAYTDFELGICAGVFDSFSGLTSLGSRAQR